MNMPTISSLWIGSHLSFLEQLCLKSFADNGHRVKLYSYQEIKGVPPGVELHDASSIMPAEHFIMNADFGAPGPHADRFRYLLLSKTNEIWADTDAYCRLPFPDSPYIFAPHFKNLFANGVLRLPQDSKTLANLIAFTSTEYPEIEPDFRLRPPVRAVYNERQRAGEPMHVSEFNWEIWGPDALTHYLNKNGEAHNAMQGHLLYPIDGRALKSTLMGPARVKLEIPEDCISIHFFGSYIRKFMAERFNRIHPRSLMAQLCNKHDIDPKAAPIGM